ncbi:porin PorA family protein [Frankia sp. Cj5]|uniref:porin PorA family protein n=1 Tax=Frankia sp. Cj5 TaxID=2880978 RepID=UPI001EF4748D|nr:porin PorA family protein [Frankia sp. Cj5]
MALRRSSILLGTAGLLLVALALIERFAVVPILTRLPGDTNISFDFAGTGTLLNTKALASGDMAHVLQKDVPLTMERQVRVVSTSGDVAIIHDDSTLHAGPTVLPASQVYAVDRSTLEATTPPAGVSVEVEPASGLTVGFPIHPKADNSYQFYDSVARQTVPVTYEGADGKYFGRSVGIYHAVSTGPVQDAELSHTLPAVLPKDKLAPLVSLLPADVQTKLLAANAALPNAIPMHYTVTKDLHVWIDTVTGLAVKETANEKILAGVSIDGQVVSLLPVLAVDLTVTPHSQEELARKSAAVARQLTMVEVIVPIVLGALGLVLLAAAIIRQRRSSHRESAPIIASLVATPGPSTDAGSASWPVSYQGPLS